MVTEVRFEHFAKVPSPIYLSELGIVIEVSSEQFKKADPAIPIVPSFIIRFVFVGIVPLYS